MLITLVRHGESVGNVSARWQGWTDGSLTNHGIKQAARVAERLSEEQFTIIMTSDLQRARLTAESIAQRLFRPTTIHVDARLRECYFGSFEDKSYRQFHLPAVSSWREQRQQRYPDGGESLDDMLQRARQVLDDLLSQYVCVTPSTTLGDVQSYSTDVGEPHVLLVSHGIFLQELVNAVCDAAGVPWRRVSMVNTAVTTLRLGLSPSARVPLSFGGDGGTEMETSMGSPSSSVPFRVEFLVEGYMGHLANLVRQKGGIGSAAHDPKQMKLTSFFCDQKDRGSS